MWKGLLLSLMRRYIAGYGITSVRKILCTSTFGEKEKSTANGEIHMQEGDNP